MTRAERSATASASGVATWPLVAVGVLCGLMSAAYGYIGVIPPSFMFVALSLVPLLVVAQWIQQDARLHRVNLMFDWGFIGYMTWPLFLPWYALRTRGRGGWRLMLGLFATVVAPYLGYSLGWNVGGLWPVGV